MSITDTSRWADVNPFTQDYEFLTKFQIVDATIICAFPFRDEIYLLKVRYALSVPAMGHNLMRSVIKKEVGVDVRFILKMQC